MKEKLIELIEQKQVYGIDIEQPRMHELRLMDNDELADHLIANGVTIQRWIPVAERLPENKQTVLAIRKDGSMFIGYYIHYIDTGVWRIWTARNSTKIVTKTVTHWMPLPEAPKGE